ncbi:MAG: dihydroorotate dehydrogenase electron transfer subunit [Desulfobacterales bacterium]|nr:MAG: dihydroorotate dehydrogenase electron transfer subunit [Desulfobacterales bacterium]
MLRDQARVLWNQQVAPSCYRMALSCHSSYSQADPGQFVMVRLADRRDPLLRRPFSIHSLITENGVTIGIELLYKVIGVGTEILSRQKAGAVVDILGPLGKGFTIPDRFQRIFIVAGGIGVAPMVFLVARLRTRKADLADCKAFLGGKSKDDLLCQADLVRLGIPVHLTTDDGSCGDQCLVTHPVEMDIKQHRPEIIYACGPTAMLECVWGIAAKYGITCQVSIEAMMACGMGACLGCAVESRRPPGAYLHACLDGPVFDAQTLKW